MVEKECVRVPVALHPHQYLTLSLSLFLSLFFFFLLHWVFIAECKFSLVAASEGYSLVAGCELLVLMASLVAENGPRAHKLQ